MEKNPEQEVYDIALEAARQLPAVHTVHDLLRRMEMRYGCLLYAARQYMGGREYARVVARALLAHQETDP